MTSILNICRLSLIQAENCAGQPFQGQDHTIKVKGQECLKYQFAQPYLVKRILNMLALINTENWHEQSFSCQNHSMKVKGQGDLIKCSHDIHFGQAAINTS